MGFEVQLLNRAFEEVPWPAGVAVKVTRYGARAVGGPSEAEIVVSGDPLALGESLRWLRYGVVVRNGEGTAVWWGYVDGVDVVAGALRDRVALQSMWNRVAVTYAYAGAGGGFGRAETSWVQDDESVGRFGTREYLYSLGDGESASAAARRDEILRQVSRPVALPLVDGGAPGVKLYCRGWWETLGWKYFERLEGRIENEGTGNETTLPFGWKLVGSNQVNFEGLAASYTRTVTAATNATPIVITTSVAHAVKGGDVVVIAGVLGNTAANGTFKAKNVAGTTFELTDQTTGADIAGNGAYTSGGTLTVTLSYNSATTIRYGKKITGATNATPVVVTCAAHGFINGNVVRIAGVEGNTAANGEWKVASAAANTFALTNANTGVNVAGSGDYAMGGVVVNAAVVGPFDGLKVGQVVTVSGSTSNNNTFTVIEDGGENGNTVGVVPALTTEFAGASVTIQLHGEQVAQSFLGVTNFSAKRVAVKLGKVGAPGDSVSVQLRNDTAGNVGSTVLASGSISNSLLNAAVDWVWVELGSAVALVAGTRYWVVIYRNSTVDASNYYVVQFDASVYETTKVWNGSAWVAGVAGYCVPLRVWATEDVLAQVRRMLTEGGQFFVAQDAEGSHGVSLNQWRDGERRALTEIESLLATTGSNGRRLLANVNVSRAVQVFAEPVAAEDDAVLTRERWVEMASGQAWGEGVLPVGRWLVRDGLPGGVDIMLQRAIFVEEAVYDVGSRSMSQLRLRGSEEFFA